MKKIPDKSFDVTFTSPPYNDTGTKNEDVANLKSNNTHKKYKSVEYRGDYFEWMCECIDEMRRVTKKYVLFNIQGLVKNRKNVYKLIGHYADYIHDILIWYKPNGTPTSTPHKISNTYEYILVIKVDGVKGVDVNSKFYRNVIVQNVNSNKEFHKIHRAVMNKNISDEIIKEFTCENDLVLDPFMGLATTGISCIENGRRFMGFEIDKEYFEVAKKRIEDRYKELEEEKKEKIN